ncbi:MAG: hypothetical protein ACJAUQ_001055 [Maribacter sp.]|jgi:hypothetical protein
MRVLVYDSFFISCPAALTMVSSTLEIKPPKSISIVFEVGLEYALIENSLRTVEV